MENEIKNPNETKGVGINSYNPMELEFLRAVLESNGIKLGGNSKELKVRLPNGNIRVLGEDFNMFENLGTKEGT